MILAIDASRATEERKTDVGWFCYHLLAHLKDVIPLDQRVILYSDQPLPDALTPWPGHWEERILRWPPKAPSSLFTLHSSLPRWPMWSQLVLANAVLRDQPDALFVPAHVIPFGLTLAPRSRRPKLITTIHDVVFKQFPETYTWRERLYADHATKLAVRHADRIIVPTEAVKRDLERWYRCDPEKVAVIHHGVTTPVISAPKAHPPLAETEHEVEKSPSGLSGDLSAPLRYARDDEKIILYVGRLEHKKNVVRMIQSFELLATRNSQLATFQLVLTGPPGHGYEDVRAAIERSPVRDRIVTPGWVDQNEYHRLLSRATAFLFPTLGEGFGLPILEACASGVPVITSRGGAHEEVAGDAALLVDPLDPRAIVDAIERLLRDGKLHADLVRRGKQRASGLTWQRSAQQTWNVLRQHVLSI